MAGYCFVCDQPVTGDACTECGRVATWVPDEVEERHRSRPWERIPTWGWVLLVVVLVAIVFALLPSSLLLE